MVKQTQSDVQPVPVGNSSYNRESGKKTLMLVGIMITIVVLLCFVILLLMLHII